MVKGLTIIWRYIYKASKKNQLILLFKKIPHRGNEQNMPSVLENNNIATKIGLYQIKPWLYSRALFSI